MNRTIIVDRVFDYHDCRGKKTIEITDYEDTHLLPSRFRMTSNMMLPFYKTMLSCVIPQDYVIVEAKDSPENVLLAGEYVDIINPEAQTRDHVCRCGSGLITDGFDVYCPNPDCRLTILARLERLANTVFFPVDFYGQESFGESIEFTGAQYSSTPFKPIMDQRMWGIGTDSVDVFLLSSPLIINTSTFLVERLFASFLDDIKRPLSYNNNILQSVGYFFGYLSELFNRREYNSPFQNHLIKSFIWSLGIQSLSTEAIRKMLVYETGVGYSSDALAPYLFLLTNTEAMEKELGMNPIESRMVYREFYNRRYEMHDIFMNYCNRQTVLQFMGHMLK